VFSLTNFLLPPQFSSLLLPSSRSCSLLESVFPCEVKPPVSTTRTGFRPHFPLGSVAVQRIFFGTRSIFVHFIFWCRWTMSFAAWAHCEFFSFSTLSAGSILTPSSSFYCVSDLILRRLGHSRSALVQEQRPRSSPLLRFSALATGSPRLQAHKQTLR
jgi:hypothetical protein